MNEKLGWSFEIGSEGDVILALKGHLHPLGTMAEVLPYMEAFLATAEHAFEPRFGGRTVDAWDQCWVPVGPLNGGTASFPTTVGLYRAILNGQIVYIGKGREHANGGLRKRLRDYTRSSDSARRTGAGPRMWENRDGILIELLITGADRAAAFVADQIEGIFIERYDPPWNVTGRGPR